MAKADAEHDATAMQLLCSPCPRSLSESPAAPILICDVETQDVTQDEGDNLQCLPDGAGKAAMAPQDIVRQLELKLHRVCHKVLKKDTQRWHVKSCEALATNQLSQT